MNTQKYFRVCFSTILFLLMQIFLFCGSADKAYGSVTLTMDQANYITPSQSPEENYEKIQYCLDTYKIARLAPGIFNISNALTIKNGAFLTSSKNNTTWPTIQLVNPDNNVINITGDNSEVSLITINYNNKYLKGNFPCKSVLQIVGNNNFVNNCHIKGGNSPQSRDTSDDKSLKTMTGVYIFGSSNRLYNNQIYNNSYGVIFGGKDENEVDSCNIYYNKMDGVTLKEYGKIVNSTIHHNGYDCMNGVDDGGSSVPIPGAGIYATDNYIGAYIQGNTIYDNNGNGIDIINSANFILDSNYSYDPGNRDFPEAIDYGTVSYGGGSSIVMCNVRDCTITNNTAVNNRSSNFVDNTISMYKDYNTNHFFSANGSAPNSDLPSGGNQVIAFILAEQSGTKNHTIHNTIRNNNFRAGVSEPYVGLGFFTSRGTGFGQTGIEDDSYWGPDSTNYFTLNKTFGSNIGSKRCGANWYAANGTDLNDDDTQHTGDGYNWSRNDYGYEHYK